MKRYGASLLLLILIHIVSFTAQARDFYWIGGSGNFNDIKHWSDQPGGKVNPWALLPDKEDNVYFDEYSFPDGGASVTITSVARCANMHWGSVKNMPTLTSDDNNAHYLVVYGGLTFNNNMILDLDRPLYFRASTEGNEIDFGGNVFDGDLIFENNGGWRITSDLDLLNNDIYFNQGLLSIEATVSCGQFISENSVTRELYLNSSNINLSDSGNAVISILTDHLLVDAGDSKINILSNNSLIETSGSKNIEFYDVIFEGNSGVVSTTVPLASFNNLTFKQDGSLKGENDFQELLFTQGFSYFIDSDGIQKAKSKFIAKGTCYAFITIKGGSSGGFISAETVDLEYLKVNNITASGSAVNFDAKTSYDLGGNSGWSFGAPSSEDYIWTGAGADNKWSNYLNWDKGCVPSRNNNAFIGDGYTVEIDLPAECKSLTVNDASTLDGSGILEIYASLTATNSTWTYDGETYFKGSNSGNSISINASLAGSVIIDGSGDWSLTTDLSVANDLYLNKGTLKTDGYNVSIDRFVSNSSATRAFDISNSNVQINKGSLKAWHVEGGGFSVFHANSTITLVGGAEFYNNSPDGVSYGKVVFNNSLADLVYLTNADLVVDPVFDELIFSGRAKISGNHQFTKVVFSKGNEYQFQAGSSQKILSADGLIAEGTCSDYITFKGDGGIAFIDSDVSSSKIVRIRIEDVNVKGGVLASADGGLVASQSIAVSGYDGWVFPDDLVGEDIYWIGKIDDNWFEAENWEKGCIPTRKDNVFFDDSKVVASGSFEVNISQKGSVAECNNMTWVNASGMTFSGDQPINIFGNIDMSGMIAGSNSYSGAINFEAEKAATIKIGNVQLLSDLNFIGNQQEDGTWLAGPWSIISELVTTGNLDLKHGVLTTNGNNIEVSEFYSNYAGADQARSLNLGASVLRVDRMEISADEFTFDAGTSTIQFAKAQDLIISKGDETLSFNNITFEKSDGNAYVDVFADNVSFNNMVFAGNTYFRKRNDSKISFTAENIQMAVGKTYVFEAAQTYILGGLIANGACEGTIDITGSDSDAAIFQAKTGVSNIEVNSVNLLNIHAEPDNVFVAKKSLDLGNTDGWKFEDEPVGDDLFWVGGTGDWDDPDHWATTSGGTPDGCVPTAKDNVYFDANSFGIFDPVVYTGAGDIRCRTMDWTGSEGNRPNLEMGDTDISGVYIYGSFILNSALTIDLSPFVNFYFRATEAQDINTFGYVFPNRVEFDGKEGVWTMQSSLIAEGDILIQYGNINSNENDIECRSIVSSEPTDDADSRGLNIENSELVITGIDDEFDSSIYLNLSDTYGRFQTFNLLADGSTIRLEADDAKIVLSGTSSNSISFNDVTFEQTGWFNSGFSGLTTYASHLLFKENGYINGKKNSFGKLELSRGFEFQLEDNRTIEMDFLLVEGSCFAPIYLHSNDDGKQAFIKSANNVSGDFLQLKDINADTAGEISYIATNSQDLGNVTGWNIDEIIAPISLYWTGNGADDSWHNHENWSRAADGSEEGCVPTLNDDVFFTVNSFLGSKLVEVLSDAVCHNMTWEDDIDPAANFSVNEKIQFGGFMDLAESMKLDMKGTLEFVGDGISGNKSIDFADKSMDGDIIFNGDAQSWIWESGFTSSGNLNIEAGSVTTKEYNFSVGKFNSTSTFYRYFNMTGSRVSITSSEDKCWNMVMNTPLGMDFIATDTQLDFENGGELFCTSDGDVTFGFVDFYDNGIININSASDLEHGHFGAVKFHEQGQVFGTNDFTNLEFTLGYEDNTIESGKTITVEFDLIMEGVRCSYVFLKASTPGDIAYIHKPTGLFEKIYNASFEDIQGSTGSGAINHPVKYHYDFSNTTGFELLTEDTDGDGFDDENPPAFEETFEKQEWCSNIAQIDNVEGFPINSKTTFQWYFSDDDGATYEELPGETNAVIEVSESGFYKVEVIYDTGSDVECIIESFVEVVLGTPSTVSLEITSHNVKCFGQENGYAIAKVKDNATGNYPDFTFFWEDEGGNTLDKISTNTDEWTSTALDLAPGKYYVTVADVKKCEFNTIVNIFDAYELLIDNVDATGLTCYTVPTGEINVDASGGTGNLSYYLNDELQADGNISGLFSGDYTVYVQDENNCKTDAVDVTLDSKPEMQLSLSGSNILCFGDTNGEIDPVVSGGVPEYSYAWTGPGGFSSTGSNLTGLSGGLYELTVTDNVGCTTFGEQEIEEPLELIASELVVEPANCHGESTGEIFVVGGQGTRPYSYLLDGKEDDTGIFSGLAPENYALRIVDAHGCIYDKDIEVSEPNEVGFLVDDKVLPSCEKNEDGIIHITPYGGNDGYSFTWNGPNDYKSYQQNIENLVAGKYALQITDKKNCTSIDFVDLDLGLTLQVGLVVEQHVKVTGGNDGILAIELIEGKPPYTYTLSGPTGVVSSPDLVEDNYYLIENLSAGVYTIIATDISGCSTVEKSVIIEEPNSLYAYIKQIMPVGCVGGSDGELKAVVGGGSGTYTYLWTGPGGYTGSGENISGLTAGTYNVVVSDVGESASASFELLPADPIVVSVKEVTNVSCYQAADGEIELSVDVGDVDYTIEWTSDNGFLSSAKHILDLEPGTYNYVVSTVAGCNISGSQDIIEPLPLNLTVTPTDISIEGERDGKLSANFGNGTSPYTVLVSGPNGYSFSEEGNTSGSISIDGLEMGIYEVVVMDANGCRIEDAKKVHEPLKLLVYTTDVKHVICPGGDDGAISIGIDFASDPANLSFSWEADNYFRSNDKDISNLKAGIYRLTVYDSGGDPGYEEQTIIVIVEEPDVLSIDYNTVDISCPGMTDGYINIQAQGGTPGYTFNWTGTGVVPTNEDQNNLEPGIYTVTITDINACVSEPIDIEITEPAELNVSVADLYEPTCFGYEDGWIQLDISDGTGPYIIEWDNYGSVTQRIEGLEDGFYHYNITDDNGCVKSNEVELNEPDTLIAEILDYEDVKCAGESSGRAYVDISGGTVDYEILWSDGHDGQELSDIFAGRYEVKVTDAHGCKDISSVEIFEPEPIDLGVEAIRPTTYESKDGALNIQVTGGVPDYVLNWVDQDLNLYSGDKLEDLERGVYDLTITDQNNCVLDSTIRLEYLFERRIKIPKAFTPNADGYNDNWDIERIEFIQDLKIVIYDRWGKAVYKFSGTGNEYKGEPWTGVDGSQKLPIGSYYYAVTADEEKPIIGTVTILR